MTMGEPPERRRFKDEVYATLYTLWEHSKLSPGVFGVYLHCELGAWLDRWDALERNALERSTLKEGQ